MPIRQLLFTISYSVVHNTLISHLSPLAGHEWVGALPGKQWGSRTRRDELKAHIKSELEAHQGKYCAYCGLPLYRTSAPQIDHIAPKDTYPAFIFEPKNLALACSLCNGFTKKSNYNTIALLGTSYSACTFEIVHPYFDDPNIHYTFLAYLGHPCLIQLNTPKAINSNSIFQLDSPEMTEERYKEALKAANPLPANLNAILDQVRNREYTSV
jgi:uncharacterized protein (TIGR02646 family)